MSANLTARPAVLKTSLDHFGVHEERTPPFTGVLHRSHAAARVPLVKKNLPRIRAMTSSHAVALCLEIAQGRDDETARAFVEACIRHRSRGLFNDGHPYLTGRDHRYHDDPEQSEARKHRDIEGEHLNVGGAGYLEIIHRASAPEERSQRYDTNWTLPHQSHRETWRQFGFRVFDPELAERNKEYLETCNLGPDASFLFREREPPRVKYFPSARNRAVWTYNLRRARRSTRFVVDVKVGNQHAVFARKLLTDGQRMNAYVPGTSADHKQLAESLQKMFSLMRQPVRDQAQKFAETLG